MTLAQYMAIPRVLQSNPLCPPSDLGCELLDAEINKREHANCGRLQQNINIAQERPCRFHANALRLRYLKNEPSH